MKIRNFLIIAIVALLLALSVSATIINIPDDYATIQAGIDASSDGDTVLVQPGTYAENLNIDNRSIKLASLFYTTGDTSYISSTIIDGDSSGSVIRIDSALAVTSAVIGFTIQNGYEANSAGGINISNSALGIINNHIINNHGSGIVCVQSTPSILHNFLASNNADSIGGGIACIDNSDAAIIGNQIIGNTAGFYGGAVYSDSSSPYISQNIINDNQADSSGGAIWIVGGYPQILDNEITGNSSMHGAAIFIICEFSRATIRNNVIENNQGGSEGAVMFYNASGIFENNEIRGNLAGKYGGGIVCRFSGFTILTIRNNNIIGNSSDSVGGAIYCFEEFPDLFYNVISENTSLYSGGGIYMHGGGWVGRNNIIADNHAGANGGGIYFLTNYYDFHGQTIVNNWADSLGGGVYIENGRADLRNDLISGNHAQIGAGIYSTNVDFRFYNITVTGNAASLMGGGMICYSGRMYGQNGIVWDNMSEQYPDIYLEGQDWTNITYSNIEGGWQGNGNLNIYPLFRNPEEGDFHLMAVACGDSLDSPLIDMGTPYLQDSLLDCSWGLGEIRSDMGAFAGGAGFVDIDDRSISIPERISLMQNYPNPFNLSTLIKYELLQQSQVTIAIYDILGRKVSTLEDAVQPAGYHELIWNAEGLSSGMYFYKLQAGDYFETKKMMLIK